MHFTPKSSSIWQMFFSSINRAVRGITRKKECQFLQDPGRDLVRVKGNFESPGWPENFIAARGHAEAPLALFSTGYRSAAGPARGSWAQVVSTCAGTARALAGSMISDRLQRGVSRPTCATRHRVHGRAPCAHAETRRERRPGVKVRVDS